MRKLLLGWASSWPQSLLSAVVVVIVFVVLGLSAWAGVMLAQDSAGSCADKFGGPYLRGGNVIKKEKIEDFEKYESRELFFSKATEMSNMENFESSIRGNLPFPYGDRRQMYNYVIAEDCSIFVATWKGIDLNAELGPVARDGSEPEAEDGPTPEPEDGSTPELEDGPTPELEDGPTPESEDGSKPIAEAPSKDKCPGGRDFTPRDMKDRMINWFPEEADVALGVVTRSPCWLDLKFKGDRDALQIDGLLDAISKHFMLAQGAGTSIRDFNATTWAAKKVAYAGEILVDLDECSFRLNSNSGTYRPLAKYVPDVNKFFAEQLGRPSMEIFAVSPWC